jgi:hypothetical protein
MRRKVCQDRQKQNKQKLFTGHKLFFPGFIQGCVILAAHQGRFALPGAISSGMVGRGVSPSRLQTAFSRE